MAVVRTSKVDLPVNGTEAYAYVAQPDDDARHPGVVLIQEWWGIEPHVMELAQKLAAEGFVVAVPDLYHGKVATEPDDAQRMMMMVTDNVERAVKEIIGALDTVKTMPNVEPKKPGIMGFCMGGFLTFLVAERYRDLGAVVPFYPAGYEPSPQEVAKVNAPVMAFYGDQDAWCPPEQARKIEQVYKQAGKNYTGNIYHAGHAFVNPNHGDYNEAAATDAWPKAVAFLKQQLQ